MKHWQISRRTMLKATGISIALPCLDIMAEKTNHKIIRSAFLYYPNGTPTGSFSAISNKGKLSKLNKYLSPLEKYKEDIIITQKMWTPRSNGHGQGTATWLTCGSYDHRKLDAGGISIDQLIASKIGHLTPLQSLELSLKGEGFFSKDITRNNISWRKSNLPCAREIEPRAVFDRLFRNKKSALSDKSILDAVMQQARDIQRKGSIEDREKIDEYMDAIRSIEKQIDYSERKSKTMIKDKALTESLVRPQEGIPPDNKQYMRLMMDMIVLAFWVDATRVISFMLDHGQSNRYFNFIDGVKGTWHALSHWRDASGNSDDDDGKTSWSSNRVKKHMYAKVSQWHHEQFAYLLSRLKAIKDQGATLLDHCQIVYGSNLADGDEHDEKNLPIIIAGGAGGKIKTGQYLNYKNDTSMAKLYLTMLHNTGINEKTFADEKNVLDLS